MRRRCSPCATRTDRHGRRRPGDLRRDGRQADARKIRRLYNDRILAGFAGSAADSFALFSRFEAKLEQYRGNLERSAVELAKDWRTDRHAAPPRSDADRHGRQDSTFLLSGNGDLIEPDDGIVAIGSGGPYALAAAKALARHTDARRARDRREGDGDCREHLHLHQRQHHHRRARRPTARAASYLPETTASTAESLTPRQIVAELDKYVDRPGRRPSARSRLRCATACGGRSCRRSWPRRSRRRTS